MAGKKKKKGGHEEAENSERWLLTYADMITLLMAFFIMMYSMSVMNLTKFNQVAFSIRSGFGGVLQGGSHLLSQDPGKGLSKTPPLTMDAPERQAEQRMVDYLITSDVKNKITVSRDKRGVMVSIAADNLLFAAGSATIQPCAYPVLKKLATILKQVPNDIMVEGHTCSQPINTAQFPSNWELSTARASSVVRFLAKQGVGQEHLIATGYGDTRPLMRNDTEAHRTMNRRVDIVLVSSNQQQSMVENTDQSRAARRDVPGRVKPLMPKVWKPEASSTEGEE